MSARLNILGILVVSERKNDGNRKSGGSPFFSLFHESGRRSNLRFYSQLIGEEESHYYPYCYYKVRVIIVPCVPSAGGQEEPFVACPGYKTQRPVFETG